MSLLPSSSPCCESDCTEATSVPVRGIDGEDGINGTNGTDGEDGYTTTTASFTMPDRGFNVTIAVASSAPFAVGQIVFISVGGATGYFEVISKPTATSLEVQNLENTASALYLSNSNPTTSFSSGALVVPGGLQGPSGDDASGAPTTSQYILQTADAALTSAQALDALTDGAILKTNAGGTGALEAAVEGTDYLSGTSGLTKAGNLSGLADAATARSNLGLVIGTNVQAYDATLASIAALGTSANRFAYTTGVDTWVEGIIGTTGLTLVAAGTMAVARSAINVQKGYGIIGEAVNADMNTSGDNSISIQCARFRIDKIMIENASVSLTTATASVYTGAGATGTLIAADQALSDLTASTKFLDMTLQGVAGTDVFATTIIYFRVGTPQGSAATATVRILGWDLD